MTKKTTYSFLFTLILPTGLLLTAALIANTQGTNSQAAATPSVAAATPSGNFG